MNDEQLAAPETAADEAASPELEKAKEKGQVETPPAEVEEDGETPEPEAEEVSEAKARRERRKAAAARTKQELHEARENERKANERLARIRDASQAAQPPKVNDFEDYNDYLIAMAAHQSVAAFDKRQASEVEEEAAGHRSRAEAIEREFSAAQTATWAEHAAEGRARYADFDKVVGDNSLPITADMVQAIISSDLGADLAYYLGTHREEAARIANLEPLEAGRALGAIEARLSIPKPRTNSTTPEPITPVKPKAAARHKDPEKMTFAEYSAWREAGGTF